MRCAIFACFGSKIGFVLLAINAAFFKRLITMRPMPCARLCCCLCLALRFRHERKKKLRRARQSLRLCLLVAGAPSRSLVSEIFISCISDIPKQAVRLRPRLLLAVAVLPLCVRHTALCASCAAACLRLPAKCLWHPLFPAGCAIRRLPCNQTQACAGLLGARQPWLAAARPKGS